MAANDIIEIGCAVGVSVLAGFAVALCESPELRKMTWGRCARAWAHLRKAAEHVRMALIALIFGRGYLY
jgi:hypothetical protein